MRKSKEKPETCRYCTRSVICKRRQIERFNMFGLAMYKVTPEEDNKFETKLAGNCTLKRERVYHG